MTIIKLAQYLREAGVDEATITKITAPGIHEGQSFGGCLTRDVGRLVHSILFHQGAGHVVLRISRPLFDEAGHLNVKIEEIGAVPEQERAIGWWAHVQPTPGDTAPGSP